MSKRKTLFIVLLFILLSYLGYNVVSKSQEKNAVTNSIKTIPDFSYATLNNTIFANNNLNPNLSTVFLYFNSECDYCQYEAQSIADSIDKFKDIQLIFISTEPADKIKMFSGQYNLNNKENIIFLNDNEDSFSKLFNANSIPFTLIYDKEQNLIKTHKGQLNAIGILRIVNK
ncbi:MAG: redoxin domain-containing protein [Flavobacteriaceae bacterium]|nr:MAG: redoxin domain-containing protein [Flavobacteriaceae bacterium]